MIRLTWLQFRAQAVTAAAALAAFAVLLAVTGPHWPACTPPAGSAPASRGSCQDLAGSFQAQLTAPPTTQRYTCSASRASSSRPPSSACSGARR